MRFFRALLAGLLIGSGLLLGPAADPPPVAGLGPLPPCRIDDILTIPRDYDDWSVTLVDWTLSVGKGYKPPDLVSVRQAGLAGGGYVREVAIDDLRAMTAAARKNGSPLQAWSPYRSYTQQVSLFNGYAKGYGYDDAIKFSARPGHSEHQLGLTIDFVSLGDDGLRSDWEKTRAGGWMAKHAWEYGWLMSYPKGKSDITCFNYEPWHYRYVGREMARKIRDSGLTIREYLWTNHTLVDPVTGEPVSTATPAPSPSPSPSPEVSPTPGASPSPALTPPLATPGPTSPPTSGVGLMGAPGLAIASVLLVVLAIGSLAALAVHRRARRA